MGLKHINVRGYQIETMTMAALRKELPETMISPETGETLYRDVRAFTVTFKGKSATVELPGYYPTGSNDGIHVGDDMAVTDAALRALKEEVEGIPTPVLGNGTA